MKINFDKLPNRKVEIFAETAYDIIEKCKEVAAKFKPDSQNLFSVMAELIMMEFSGETPSSQSLRNMETQMLNKRDPLHPENLITYMYPGLFALITIAGYDSIETLEKQRLQLISYNVLYAPKPWPIWNLVRVPQSGLLTQSLTNWNYNDGASPVLKGNVLSVSHFAMPGDRTAYWLKVIYSIDGDHHTAYFAATADNRIQPITKAPLLMRFFNKLEQLNKQPSR